MKTIKILFGALFAVAILAFTSIGDKAPKKVLDAFANKFPNANDVKWEKENETEWEAEFKMDKIEYSSNFLEDGTWKETEHEIDEKDIPLNVKKSLMESFPGFEIEEAEISETPNEIIYEFEIEKGEVEMSVVMTTDGKIVKQEIKKDNGDDGDDGDDN
jgi:uncharacterized membrane protein YkoI